MFLVFYGADLMNNLSYCLNVFVYRCEFNYRQGLWILSWEEAIQLAYGVYVVLLMCPFMPELIYRRASEVFLHQ
jgi:hypothetical protein